MFKYTNYADGSAQKPQSPKPRTRNASISKPTQGIEKPMLGLSAVPKPKTPVKPQKDKSISEKYTNRAYNRVPSPKERFHTLASAAKDNRPSVVVGRPSVVEEGRNKPSKRPSERVQALSSRPNPLPRSITSSVKHSYSDIISKKRPLEMECQKSNTQPEVQPSRARPKTSHCPRTESHLGHKVLHTVESVLSRAVMQQGKIDETNIENIIISMRNSLYHEKNLDDELSDIDVELKPSMTTLNEITLSEEQSTDKKTKPLCGIVRKDNSSTKPEQKPYVKIYDQTESPSKQTMNNGLTDGDNETLLYMDIPDLVFPDFPSSKKGDGKISMIPKIEINASKQNIQIETSKRNGFSQHLEVGDFQTKENPFWNPSEDMKLKQYVESLIQNMKTQMNECNQVVETEGEIDSQGTVCRSFCVCKVCVSKNTQSKSVLKQKPSTMKKPPGSDEKQKPLESTVGRLVRSSDSKRPVQREANNRLRVMKPSSKGEVVVPPCKVIRNTNPNFKPEASAVNTSLHAPDVNISLHAPAVNKGTSYTMVDSANNPEEGDDMYLQRRIRRAPSRKTSSKIK